MSQELSDLIILAGGKGSRIRRYLKNKPKPLIKIGNTSILEKILYQFCKYEFRKIFIICGYKGEQIFKKFNNTFLNFNKIICLKENKPMGTAGFINKNIKIFTPTFYVVNADSYCDFNFEKFKKIKLNNSYGKIILTKNKSYNSNKKLNNLNILKNKVIDKNYNNNLMNAGIYFLKSKCFNINTKNEFLSLEDDIISPLINKKKILGFRSNNFFLDIGTPANLKKAKTLFDKNFTKPAIFLDRDGTINEDIGYLHKFRDFKLKKNILKFLKYLSKKKVYLFIVTNQAGIGKKIFTMKQFINFQKKFKHFFSNHNIYFDEVIFCPYHINAKIKKYKKKSLYRKPGNLMVESILKRWNINKSKSIFIGDRKKDKLCAKKSNIKFFYYRYDLYRSIKKLI